MTEQPTGDEPSSGVGWGETTEPRLDSTIVRTVPNGTPLSRLADCRADNSGRTWSKLELDGQPVWAVADYLRRQ